MPFRIDRLIVVSIALLLFLLPFVSYGNWMLNTACVIVLLVYAGWQLFMIILTAGTKYQQSFKRHKQNLIYAAILFGAALVPTKLISFYVQQQVNQFIIVVHDFKVKNGYFPKAADISDDYLKVQMNIPQFVYQTEGQYLANLEFAEPGMAVESLVYDFSSQNWQCTGSVDC